ncbi:hypothetical protein BN2497_11997 [Janthinobacterium sp. CG23_2]|nr:hypothetical protein BN2497_11997 [Janthinobacterium sp. CG23_2]CUU32396.1 hypothetical protein BN3177_11997 [Janthinobacterium sp. CG23_2]
MTILAIGLAHARGSVGMRGLRCRRVDRRRPAATRAARAPGVRRGAPGQVRLAGRPGK